jgi:hypothetical protein
MRDFKNGMARGDEGYESIICGACEIFNGNNGGTINSLIVAIANIRP